MSSISSNSNSDIETIEITDAEINEFHQTSSTLTNTNSLSHSSNIEITHNDTPVSYTHLTLPTKRIV